MTAGADYMAALDAWRGKVNGGLKALARQSVLDLAQNVVLDTPVDTGFLRGGWQPTIGGIPAPQGDGEHPLDPGGGIAVANIGLKAAELEPGELFVMANFTVYALRLEYGFVGEDSLGRYYNQAGRYFVTNNVAMWDKIVAYRANIIWGGK